MLLIWDSISYNDHNSTIFPLWNYHIQCTGRAGYNYRYTAREGGGGGGGGYDKLQKSCDIIAIAQSHSCC